MLRFIYVILMNLFRAPYTENEKVGRSSGKIFGRRTI